MIEIIVFGRLATSRIEGTLYIFYLDINKQQQKIQLGMQRQIEQQPEKSPDHRFANIVHEYQILEK